MITSQSGRVIEVRSLASSLIRNANVVADRGDLASSAVVEVLEKVLDDSRSSGSCPGCVECTVGMPAAAMTNTDRLITAPRRFWRENDLTRHQPCSTGKPHREPRLRHRHRHCACSQPRMVIGPGGGETGLSRSIDPYQATPVIAASGCGGRVGRSGLNLGCRGRRASNWWLSRQLAAESLPHPTMAPRSSHRAGVHHAACRPEPGLRRSQATLRSLANSGRRAGRADNRERGEPGPIRRPF
jgi:hypothetical protein